VSTHEEKRCKYYKQEEFHPKLSLLLFYSKGDALLYLPQKFDYTFCLVIAAFGMILSLIMIVVFSIFEVIDGNRKRSIRGKVLLYL